MGDYGCIFFNIIPGRADRAVRRLGWDNDIRGCSLQPGRTSWESVR